MPQLLRYSSYPVAAVHFREPSQLTMPPMAAVWLSSRLLHRIPDAHGDRKRRPFSKDIYSKRSPSRQGEQNVELIVVRHLLSIHYLQLSKLAYGDKMRRINIVRHALEGVQYIGFLNHLTNWILIINSRHGVQISFLLLWMPQTTRYI